MIFDEFGNKFFYKNHILHRECGPAIVYKNSGHKLYFLNGLHVFSGKKFDLIKKKEKILTRISGSK